MSTRTHSYVPGTRHIDIAAPDGIAALLDFHRATFGDARMEDDPAAAAAAAAAAAEENEPEGGAPKLNEHGFPDKTPVADMKPEEQVAYWKHQARKHEDRSRGTADYEAIKRERDELKARTQTAEEKALEDAKAEGRAEAAKASLPRLVAAEFRAAAAGRIPADQLATLLEPLDLTKFLSADGGEVDTDKVQQYIDGIAPADGKKWPDMGQGKRGGSTKAKGVSAGRSLFEDRHAKK